MSLKLPVLLCTLFLAGQVSAQQEKDSTMLSLNDAIGVALEQNFDIRVSNTELEQAKANNTIGNAGMLPNLSATGGLSQSLTNAKIKLASGVEQNRKDAHAQGLNGAVQLDWVLFDGLRMFAAKDKLNQLQTIGETTLKLQIQNTISNVIISYAGVVRQKEQLVALDTAMSLAQVRMDLAKKKFEVGTSAKTDYLQAQVDYNASKAAWLNQEVLLRQVKDSLMITLGRDQFTNFDVQDSLHLNKDLHFERMDSWISDNYSMQLAKQQKHASELDFKIAQGALLPVLDLSGAYNYNRTQNDAGTTLFNRTYGPQAGLNLSLPIFNGFNLQRQKKVAKLEVFRQDLIVQRLETNVAAQYRSAWRKYDIALQSLNLEHDNIKYAQENVMIQQARFRVGVATTVELREAENSYVAALARLVDAAYAVKISETKLLLLQNKLLK